MTDALSFDAFAGPRRRQVGSLHRYRDAEPTAAVLPFRPATPADDRTGHCLPHDGTPGYWPGTDGRPAGSRDHDASWTDAQSWGQGGAWDDSAPAAPGWGAEQAWNDSPGWGAEQAWGEQPAAQDWHDGAAWDSERSWDGGYDEQGWGADQAWNSEPEQTWNPDERWDADPDEPADEAGPRPRYIGSRAGHKAGTGAHRLPAPPGSLKGRAAVVAVAAGAVVAAGQAALASPGQSSQAVDYEAAGQVHEIAAQSMSVADPTAASPASPQMLNISAPVELGQFSDILEKGAKYAEDLAAAESAKYRPLFAKFTSGTYTSGYGARWGVQHLGLDIAGPIGTPIYAVADGTVLEAGPASGFGMWVRLLHDDGTVTVYGHIDTATVSQGERVMAGDQIATMGNRGFSTGPHCHFEVWLNGSNKIDPQPWLATRGISLGPMGD
ncbi:peptidoglycan DD-metalloendopeptidase family protein [Nocardia sp. NPDC050697]|uniref:peptidoglycan DD-metalloendopeptidase family protein n=1 Tax=Nocardia sp. NPDC050697 TaxID=3155158 RepID=UPI003407A60D